MKNFKAHILIVDDVQFLSGKSGTQDVFFHIFNHLHQNGKQVIITSDKVYDRTVQATVDGSLSGVIFGDTVTVTKTSSVFSDINVGSGKTVTVSGISIGGPGSPNYSLQNNSTTTTANISQKSLTASYTAENKVYDRNNIATVAGELSGVISGDQVSLSNASAVLVVSTISIQLLP